MDVVPSLCASSTVGLAAVGFVLGCSPLSSPRGSPERKSFDTGHGGLQPPSTPITSKPSISEPTTRAGKISLRRPQSATIPGHAFPPPDFRGESADQRGDWRHSAFGDLGGNYGNMGGPFGNAVTISGGQSRHESLDHGGTAKSSWIRRMSTITGSQSGSLISSTRPSTPSLSFSNASTAPFFRGQASSTTPRNKLVKRSSSQRNIHTGTASHNSSPSSHFPSLRRPATSHQRSAHLQHTLRESDTVTPSSSPDTHSSTFPPSVLTDRKMAHPSWSPFFSSKWLRTMRETPLRSGSLAKSNARHEVLKCVASTGDRPTLLKPSSLTSKFSPEHAKYSSDAIRTPARQNPKASFTSSSKATHTPNKSTTEPFPPSPSQNETAQTPRRSFSITDLFSSSSSSNWRRQRGTSFHAQRGTTDPQTRRLASAPMLSEDQQRPAPWTSSRKSSLRRKSSLPRNPPPSRDTLRRVTLESLHNTRSISSPLPPLDRSPAIELDESGGTASLPTSSPWTANHTAHMSSSSAPYAGYSGRSRPHRQSMVPSERASTVFGSDNETSQVFTADGNEVDYRSDTAYDSVRTGATGSSHSGIPAPKIEAVFDASTSGDVIRQNLAALQERLSSVSLSQAHTVDSHIIEEEESARTPIVVSRSLLADEATPLRYGNRQLPPSFASSPPELSEAQRGQIYERDFPVERTTRAWPPDEVDSILWDDANDLEGSNNSPLGDRPSARFPFLGEDAMATSDRPLSNLFEWSERHPEPDGADPRPQTVHGKQVGERSRTPGRRAPSALHLRSQSVPLPPDAHAPRGLASSKLETWRLGGKGVSEDWNDDFDFDEAPPPDDTANMEADGKRLGVIVPVDILDRQASVHGQFGQVKELTLLVEELKRLRHLGNTYGITQGRASELWKEAEGIVNLATLDDEDDVLVPRSPTSTEFEYDSFEENTSSPRHVRSSGARSLNESTLSSHVSPPTSKLGTPQAGRSRKDSTAQAKVVLENIHHRVHSASTEIERESLPKKMPFDTTSLRDLVIRAGVVTRALKEIVRKAENVPDMGGAPHIVATTSMAESNLSQIFTQPPEQLSGRSSPRVVKSSSGNTISIQLNSTAELVI